MINSIVSRTKRLASVIAVVTTLALVATSAPAAAASPINGSVSVVEYAPGSLLVQVAAVNYMAQLNTQAGCTANNQTIDTIKAYQSLAQAALLAGKNVRIYFAVCNSVNYITTFDLNS